MTKGEKRVIQRILDEITVCSVDTWMNEAKWKDLVRWIEKEITNYLL